MYQLEIKLASKKGWFTPAEARSYYGKYSRDGITVHWWGDPASNPPSAHDNIVNYLNGKAAQGTHPTANYVLSDAKITKCVEPENVAWTSGNGNSSTVGIETQPSLTAEGYKKFGWLVNELEKRFGKTLKLYPHNYWMTTQCPGTLSLDRIRQEADKWKRGEYNAAPTPTPTPVENIAWTKLDEPVEYVFNKQPTNMWDFDQTSWGAFTTPVKTFNKGEKITIFGRGYNKTLRATYLVTEYSYNKGIANGFNEADLSLPVQPQPAPDPTPAPEPAKPEWIQNLRDIDETKMWVAKKQDLIDITTGKAATIPNPKTFEKDEEFNASALTIVAGKEYRITDYSFKNGIFNGLPISSLTLTAPGVPNVPPSPEVPADPTVKVSVVVEFLNTIITAIKTFIELITKK